MAMIELPDRLPDMTRVRLLMLIISVGIAGILSRLWYLQVAHGDELLEASIINQRRLIRRVPPRGLIVDRKGRVIATNRQQLSVSVIPHEIKKNPEVLPLLAQLLNRPEDELTEAVNSQVGPGAYDSVVVQEDVDLPTVTRLEEQRLNLPGVYIGPEPVRKYPDGPLFGHVLGQMGQITPDELKAGRAIGYRPGDFCGKLGLERGYDADLRGENGGREIEVDARGRMRNELDDRDPIPGHTVTLNIDEDLQKIGYQELAAKQKNGAVVAIDPRTGAVLALVSYPAYDPNMYVGGISRNDLKTLNADTRKPQINRATYSAVAPGSTFKLITSAAGLETGKIDTHSGDYCSGAISLGRWIKRCHKHGGHGHVDFTDAVAKSCDVFFYHLGQNLGPEVMADFAKKFGLGSKTGIDLPYVDKAGSVPDPEWKRKHHMEWVGGDTVDMAIGQSALGCTPLQMCNAVAAIANGGTVYKPQLVKSIVDSGHGAGGRVVHEMQPIVGRKAGVSQRTLSAIVHAMEAVMGPGGTGYGCSIPGLPIAGKTGTAQRYGHKDNAWYVGFAPVQNPQIAICVFVEEGGHGGTTAGPIAKKLFAHYFNIKTDAAADAQATD
jgi:penicillin-binding protein 2